MNVFTRSRRALAFALVIIAGSAPAFGATRYDLTFHLTLRADDSRASAAIELKQDRPRLLEARFRAPAEQFGEFSGDGNITRDGDFVTWIPPETGGRIEYTPNLVSVRSNGSYDSLITRNWALFRADDMFPAARVRHRGGARSKSRLLVSLPDGWSVITPFKDIAIGDFRVSNPERAFDRPVGWIIAGKLGRRKDMIGGTEVSIAAPVGSGVERLGILALARWTLPYLARETDDLPRRISIVSAGEPMWRGGLSASNSVYIHADRPLLSENGTSSLLHELVHVLLPVPTLREHDWIDEGVAEYITLRLLRDSGTISPERFQKALDGFARRGQAAGGDLVATNAVGAVRAQAVVVIAELDTELLALTDGDQDIYDLIRAVRANDEALDTDKLRAAALELTGAARIESLDVEHWRANASK